jgi:hypothetical protein
LDDSTGSDHNPILINLSGSSNIRLPLRPPNPIPHILDWRCYADAANDSFSNMTMESGASVDDKNGFLIELIAQSTKVAAKVRPAWWSSECDALNERQMELFRVFRRHGGTDNLNAYRVVNEELTVLCGKLKPESFKQYCSTLNCHSSLREMYDMARRYRRVQRRTHVGDFSWLPEFAEKMASPFVTPKLSFPGRRTSKLNWLVELFTIEELKSALGLCKNSSPGMDNVRFAHIRFLPESGLEFLLELYNGSLNSANWKRTRIVTILKPGKDPALADFYRPISLLSCVRKLFERMLLLRLELWAEGSGILSGTQFGFRKGRGTMDCLAVLTTEVKTAFHLKNQVLAAFLDITEAYYNVLVDILCRALK